MQYQNKQTGTIIVLIMGIATCLILTLAFFIGLGVLPIIIVIILLTFLFSSLSIKVDNNEVNWFFGPGFWRKSIKIDSIKSAKIIKTKWYYGLGIRYTPSGWLYNVSGTAAIQLEQKNGTLVNLGTNDPNNLLEAIQSRIQD